MIQQLELDSYLKLAKKTINSKKSNKFHCVNRLNNLIS